MKFSIITPTYKRSTELERAVQSVLTQTYAKWELLIINDSPDDNSYANFSENIKDSRIRYFRNEQNMGVNYSRNFALDNSSADSDFIIFLDDDDWLAKDALENFVGAIKERPAESWFVANRALKSGGPLTSAPKNNSHYSYAWSYLIFKKFKGDATHCIKIDALKNIRFSKLIKQGEEWLFFYQLGLKNKLFYSNHDSTITEGYNRAYGLNFRERTRSEQFRTLVKIIKEGSGLRLIYHPTFIMHLAMRLLRLIFKP